jgi:hypothetical protein
MLRTQTTQARSRGAKLMALMRGKPKIARRPPGKLASALEALRGTSGSPGPVPPLSGPPESIVGPSQDAAVPPPVFGAADGLGAGQGGLAVHPSLKRAKLSAYEPRHSSKHR